LPLFTARTEQPDGTLFAQYLATEVEDDLIFVVNEYKTAVRISQKKLLSGFLKKPAVEKKKRQATVEI
jgi:hypothetical protein